MDNFFEGSSNIDNKNVFLKIDTQGFEKEVIQGARKVLENVKVIQLEMSLVPLYKEELLFNDMNKYLYSLDFRLVSIETRGLSDNVTGHLYQVDGIYIRS